MVRAAGLLLVVLATAAIALGSPFCCLVGSGCCASPKVVEAGKLNSCCSHSKPSKPAPKAPSEQKPCSCKHDVSVGSSAAEHAPLVAVSTVPAIALPERAQAGVAAMVLHRAPPAPALPTHPLLL